MLDQTLWQSNADLAQACLEHPFVRKLGDGSLDAAVFKNYIAQDAFFLDAFQRAYALALARCRDAEAAATFCDLIAGVREELKLHAAYARELGIDLSRVKPNPACRAYTDFLLATAWRRPVGEILAAMTPCMRLYGFLGTELAQELGGRQSHPYRRWITTYSDEEFHQLADRIDWLLDRLAEDTVEVRRNYRYAMQCELDFFSEAQEVT